MAARAGTQLAHVEAPALLGQVLRIQPSELGWEGRKHFHGLGEVSLPPGTLGPTAAPNLATGSHFSPQAGPFVEITYSMRHGSSKEDQTSTSQLPLGTGPNKAISIKRPKRKRPLGPFLFLLLAESILLGSFLYFGLSVP